MTVANVGPRWTRSGKRVRGTVVRTTFFVNLSKNTAVGRLAMHFVSEDRILIGVGKSWTEISKAVGTRSPDRMFSHCYIKAHRQVQADASPECAKRWRNALNPNVSRSEWNEEKTPLAG